MTRNLTSQRGEGKIGCIVSLLVLVVLGATGFKVVPVMFTNHELLKYAEEVATRAAVLTKENIELQIRQKAKELEIVEALEPGAIVVTRTQRGGEGGTCRVALSYTRKVDLYGVTTIEIKTEEEKSVPYMSL